MCKVPADFPWGETLGFLSLIIGLNLCCFPQMKTVSVALVLCLNVGVDPPDVVKTSPCARLECWIGGSLRNLELKGKNVSFCLSSYASSPFLSCPLWSSRFFFVFFFFWFLRSLLFFSRCPLGFLFFFFFFRCPFYSFLFFSFFCLLHLLVLRSFSTSSSILFYRRSFIILIFLFISFIFP